MKRPEGASTARDVVANGLVAITLTTIGFVPLVLAMLLRDVLVEGHELPTWTPSALYGLWFILSAVVGKSLPAVFDSRTDNRLIAVPAIGLLASGTVLLSMETDSLLAAVVAFFITVVTAGAAVLGPLALQLASSFKGSPSLGFALATTGQLTSFGFWGIVLSSTASAPDQNVAGVYLVLSGAACAFIALIFEWRIVPIGTGLRRNGPQPSSLLFLYLSFFAVCVAATILLTRLPYLRSEDADMISANEALVVFAVSGAVGRLAAAGLFDRGWESMRVWPPLAFAAGFAIFELSGNSTLVTTGLILGAAGYGAFLPVLMVFARRTTTESMEKVSYNMFVWGSLGLGTGAALSAALSDGLVGIVSVVLAIISCTCWFVAGRRVRRPNSFYSKVPRADFEAASGNEPLADEDRSSQRGP